MAQSAQKVIAPEGHSPETTLVTPRFDEVAARMARPVVPLSEEVAPTNTVHIINFETGRTPLLSRKGSWLLAALVGLLLAIGGMAIGVSKYRREEGTSTQPLIAVEEATRVEMSRDFMPNQSPRSNTSVAPKTTKPVRRVQSVSVRPAVNDKSKARLVDAYVIRRPQ